MTFDDDFVRFPLNGTMVDVTLKKLELDWPPPMMFCIPAEPEPLTFLLVRRSSITDEQRAGMTHVARGAEYELSPYKMPDLPPPTGELQ